VDWFQEGVEEEVGVFQIKTHPEYTFQIGDLVARAMDFDYVSAINENAELVTHCKELLERRTIVPLENHEQWVSFFFFLKYSFFRWPHPIISHSGKGPARPFFGQILDLLPGGNILVVWHSRTYSIMKPEALTVVDLDDLASEGDDEGGENFEDEGWETYDGATLLL